MRPAAGAQHPRPTAGAQHRRPLIGITTRRKVVASPTGLDLPTSLVSSYYVDSVERGGGVPLLLPVIAAAHAADIVAGLDGLVLSGGGDVDPALYGAEPGPALEDVDRRRDDFEVALVQAAHAARLPVLAICRGIQILNVALGGTLIQDLPTEPVPEGGPARLVHSRRGQDIYALCQPVRIEPDSGLARLLGSDLIKVNSVHHQALRDVAPPLRPVAWAEDGVIEAVEPLDEGWPAMGLQWHPECLVEAGDPVSLRPFEALVRAATARRSG